MLEFAKNINIKVQRTDALEWIKIFESADEARRILTGKPAQLLIVRGKRICLATYQEKFFAVSDSCTHNGESLSKGMVNYQGEIICPWHNYRFELATGICSVPSCRDLEIYPVKEDATGFFIGI